MMLMKEVVNFMRDILPLWNCLVFSIDECNENYKNNQNSNQIKIKNFECLQFYR